jgi:molecular chaperone HtpG
MALRGAIDSPDIPLNVSRSTLQMDRTVRQLSQHISKKISDRLSSLYVSEREKFLAFWPDIEMIIKLGMLQDDKFYERSKDFLIWKNLEGEWTTVPEYLERHKDTYKGKVFYTAEEQQQSHILELYKQKGIEILVASSLVDTPVISLLEGKLDDVKFQRIDGAIDETILDSSREKTLLDAQGKTESFKIADFIRSKLGLNNVEVEAKSLHSDSVPALLIVDEEMRRMRETMALAQQQLPPGLHAKRTFVVNTNSKLVQSIYQLKEKDPALAQEMTQHLYELSLLSQRELEPSALSQFVARSNQILEKIIENY